MQGTKKEKKKRENNNIMLKFVSFNLHFNGTRNIDMFRRI